MRSPARRPFTSPSRAAGISEAEARKAWVPVLAEAVVIAARMAAGAAVHRDDKALFAGKLIRLKAAFPQRAVSAQALAEAFLILARANVGADWPAVLAAPVRATAEALTELLDAETRAAFARSCAAVGPADD